jgi:hypothetical protein
VVVAECPTTRKQMECKPASGSGDLPHIKRQWQNVWHYVYMVINKGTGICVRLRKMVIVRRHGERGDMILHLVSDAHAKPSV